MKSKKESMRKHTQKTIFWYNTIKFRYFTKKTMKGGVQTVAFVTASNALSLIC